MWLNNFKAAEVPKAIGERIWHVTKFSQVWILTNNFGFYSEPQL